MSPIRIAFLTAASVLTLSACSTYEAAPAPIAAAPVSIDVMNPPIDIDVMKNATRTLSSDEFEGRAPGSAGEVKTIAFMESEFTKLGVRPGNNGSFVQKVPLVEIEAQNMSPLTIAGTGANKGKSVNLNLGADFVGVTYRESDKIDLSASEMVFVGYGINAPEKGWNDYAGVDVRGKTVVILVNDADFGAADLNGTFGGKAMTYYGRWTYKFEEAARQGAAAALIIHDTKPASYGWNVVESSWTGPQFYAQTANGNADQTMMNGWMTMDSATKIFGLGGHDLPTLTAAAKKPGFKAVPLGATASVSFNNRMARMESNNIIGIIPGKTKPDEYVLYTAHWDHLGICKPDATGDNICNGAIDNATGTAALLALAKAYQAAGAPERTVVFLAVTAEESGLLGSAYYAANPVFPLEKTVGGVNMDALSVLPPARNIVVVGKGKSDLDGYLDRAAAMDNRTTEADPNPQAGYYYRSDHFPFAKRGVPMIYFDGGDDLIEGGKERAAELSADYTKNRYHQPSDEYDENWTWDGVAADLKLYYRVGRMLADTDQWPNWNEGDEFRAARDKSREGMEQ
jgi:Zn-dependent M28 family amino/carboxypeptidase